MAGFSQWKAAVIQAVADHTATDSRAGRELVLRTLCGTLGPTLDKARVQIFFAMGRYPKMRDPYYFADLLLQMSSSQLNRLFETSDEENEARDESSAREFGD